MKVQPKRSILESKEVEVKDLAYRYYDKYRTQIDLLEGSTLAKVKGKIDIYDVYALGKQLHQHDDMMRLCEELGNASLLGQIPKIAYDVITAVHGASVIPLIASVQPIEDEQGIVYFKQVRAGNTKGNLTTGQVITDPRQPVVYPNAYAANMTGPEVAATGTGAATTFNYTVTQIPVRSQSMQVTTTIAGVYGEDVGPRGTDKNIGTILGNGLSGQVNYTTGQVTLTFALAPAAGATASVSYQQDLERAVDLPSVDMYFDSVPIRASMYALKSTIGMMQSYGMQKRFGKIAEDEMSKDLVQEINLEIGGDIVRQLLAGAQGLTTWSQAPQSGVSEFDQRQSYKFSLANAEATLAGNSGRGTISLMIVGRNHASIIQTLPGFEKIYDGNTLGMHVWGTLNGIPVIRVVESSLMGTDQGICLWKGTSPWEAPVVYAPFMALTMTDLLPMAPNPLQKQRSAAVWAGLQMVVPAYATRLDIIP